MTRRGLLLACAQILMKFFRFITILLAAFYFNLPLHAELVDAIKAVVNNVVVTYAEVEDFIAPAAQADVCGDVGGRHVSVGGCTDVAGDVAGAAVVAGAATADDAAAQAASGQPPCYTPEGVPYYTPGDAPCY